MKIVKVDGFEFRFADALEAFVFDEQNNTKPTYHGAPMKRVDIIAEFEKYEVYLEVKDYEQTPDNRIDKLVVHQLVDNLKYKYRDSYLYRYAEEKVSKPIHYFCMITYVKGRDDRAFYDYIQRSLERDLPVGLASNKWVKALAESYKVFSLESWNDCFPEWSASRLSS